MPIQQTKKNYKKLLKKKLLKNNNSIEQKNLLEQNNLLQQNNIFKKYILFEKNTKQNLYLDKCLSKHQLYLNRENIYFIMYDDRIKDMRLLLNYREKYLHLWKSLHNNILEELRHIIVGYIDIKFDIY